MDLFAGEEDVEGVVMEVGGGGLLGIGGWRGFRLIVVVVVMIEERLLFRDGAGFRVRGGGGREDVEVDGVA